MDKQKKHEDALGLRISELVKSGASDKSEIKELRVKLRSSEHERAQLASKQADVGDLKKGIQSADLRRKEEVKEREKKIAELEKALTMEKRRREMAESCVLELRAQTKDEVEAVQAALKGRTTELAEMRLQLERAEAAADTAVCERDTSTKELALAEELIARMAQAYSDLSANTVPKEAYSRVHFAHFATQWNNIRLERKLANVEGQVVELAYLLRYMKEQSLLVRAQVSDMQKEIQTFWISSLQSSSAPTADDCLEREMAHMQHALVEFSSDGQRANAVLDDVSSQLQQLFCDELLSSYQATKEELGEVHATRAELSNEVDGMRISYTKLHDELTETKAKRDSKQDLLEAASTLAKELRHSSEQLKLDVQHLNDKLKEVDRQHSADLQKERELAQQLRVTIQKHLMAEEGLRAQIDS